MVWAREGAGGGYHKAFLAGETGVGATKLQETRSKIPERPLRRDFIAQRGHAPGETGGGST